MSALEWREGHLEDSYIAMMRQNGSEDLHWYERGPVRALVSRDGPEKLWHISISCEKRYPSWEELKKARYDLLPDEITVAMYLPPKSEYVNVHSNCFHWIEVRESRLILP